MKGLFHYVDKNGRVRRGYAQCFVCVKDLEAAGATRELAEAHVKIIAETLEVNLATKENLKIAENGFKQTLGNACVELKRDIEDIRIGLADLLS